MADEVPEVLRREVVRREAVLREVVLREVLDQDLPLLFAHQADPAAAAMVGFASRDRPTFDAHWARIRHDPAVLVRTIVCDGQVAGNAVSFIIDGRREIGYWIDRAFWGMGVASSALAQLLAEESRRPLYGHVIKSNGASRRVLEKNDFRVCEEDDDAIVLILTG